jgi:hypothetical protein
MSPHPYPFSPDEIVASGEAFSDGRFDWGATLFAVQRVRVLNPWNEENTKTPTLPKTEKGRPLGKPKPISRRLLNGVV